MTAFPMRVVVAAGLIGLASVLGISSASAGEATARNRTAGDDVLSPIPGGAPVDELSSQKHNNPARAGGGGGGHRAGGGGGGGLKMGGGGGGGPRMGAGGGGHRMGGGGGGHQVGGGGGGGGGHRVGGGGGGGGGHRVGAAGGGGHRVGGGGGGGGHRVGAGGGGGGKKAGGGGGGKKAAGGGGKGKNAAQGGQGKGGQGKGGGQQAGQGKGGQGKGGIGKKGQGGNQQAGQGKGGQGKGGQGKGGIGKGKGNQQAGKGQGGQGGKGGKKGTTTVVKGKPAVVIRDRRTVYRNGAFRTLVGFGTLGAILIGAGYYDPDGYVAVAQPICEGFDADGCALRWQDVPLEGGGYEPQCVQFCPRAQAIATPVPVAVPVPPMVAPQPLAPAAGCEMAVYKDVNFAGDSELVTEAEPELNDDWDKRIASIQVKAGTWDVFADANYGGESMRLPPGNYNDLGNQWTRRISSVTCSEPNR